MARFFLALGVRFEHVARPLPHVTQLRQLTAHTGGGQGFPGRRREVLAEQLAGPLDGLVAELVGRSGQGLTQEGLQLLRPDRRAVAAAVFQERSRLPVATVAGQPLVDADPADPQEGGDLGDAPPLRHFQHGERAAEDRRVAAGGQLSFELQALTGG